LVGRAPLPSTAGASRIASHRNFTADLRVDQRAFMAGDGGGCQHRNVIMACGLLYSPAHAHDPASSTPEPGAGSFPGCRAAPSRRGSRTTPSGDDLFFGPGRYAPGTHEGDRLLAHELAHVVQHAGGDAETGGPVDAERAAEQAAEGVVRRGTAGFGLRAATAASPARQGQSWAQLVAAAEAEPDLAKKTAAMVALVRQALPTVTVHEAGTSSPTAVDPADYDATPAINFDVRLNSKTKWKSTNVARGAGYTFAETKAGVTKAYTVLGPKALDKHGEVFVRMWAAHELFHAGHTGGPKVSYEDNEVEAWSDTFVKFFLPTYSEGESWETFITNYEGATSGAQTASLNMIVAFTNGLSTTPGTGASKRSDRQKLEHWLHRRLQDNATRSKRLMIDLSAALKVTPTPPPSP
jgi:hypothetical protein